MKIGCPCGAIISDGSDYLQHKAYLVADQDSSASWDEHPDDDRARFEAVWNLTKTVYECQTCGRLCIDDGGDRLFWYLPEDPSAKGVLGSKLGSAFRVHVRAHWRLDARPPGELWWDGSGDTPGGYERHQSLETLRKRYNEVKAQLRIGNRLRNAFLSVDGMIVDQEG